MVSKPANTRTFIMHRTWHTHVWAVRRTGEGESAGKGMITDE